MDRLPPLDQPVAWVVVHGHEQAGPYTLEVLISEVVAGRLAETTPVWWPPMADWTTIMANDAMAAEIERRRATDVPGWAPLSLTGGSTTSLVGEPSDGQDRGRDGGGDEVDPGPTGSVDPGAVGTDDPGAPAHDVHAAEVITPEIVTAEMIDLEAMPEIVDMAEDVEVVDAIITTGPRRDDTRFLSLVERSTHRAGRLAALAEVDDRFVAEMVAAGDVRGLGFADHHSGSDEHRINLRDVSGDRELTVLLGRVDRRRPDVMIEQVVPLTVVLSARGVLTAVDPSLDGGDAADDVHGRISISRDERSGRTTASISLLLGVDDYVGRDLVVDPLPLREDLGSVVDALDAALSG